MAAADQGDRGQEVIGQGRRARVPRPASINWRAGRNRDHLVGRAAVRVPVLPIAPDLLAGRLCLRPQFGEVDARDATVFHARHAVHDHRVDVIADAAVHQALDRVAHRAETKRIAAGQADDDDIGLAAGRQPADVVASDRTRAAERCRLEHPRGGGGFQIAARHLAEIGSVAHLQDHVARIGVGTERDVHAGLAVGLPIVEEASAPRHVDRTVRYRAVV